MTQVATRASATVQADHASAVVSGGTTNTTFEAIPDRAVQLQQDTFDGIRTKTRAKFARKLTREFLAATDYSVDSTGQALQGPNPCDECAASSQFEDDLLLTANSGSGLRDACSINGVADIGWRGKNDHCLFPGDTQFEDPNLKEVLANFTGINQQQYLCGTTMNIDNSQHTGDPAGDSRDFDPDVWEYQIVGVPALDMKMTAYAETAQIRIAMTYNFFDQTNNGNFGPITNCSDSYGIFVFPVWQSFEIRTPANCADGTWAESLQAGYWYIICFPTSTANGGPDPTAGCPRSDAQTIDDTNLATSPTNAFYYNIKLESVDPLGACCNTNDATCSEGGLKSACLTSGGVFYGGGSTCADSTCCSPMTELGAITPDWLENDSANYGSASEDLCNENGAENINEGCTQDFQGNLVNEESTPLTELGNPFSPADVCAGSEYVIKGFGGTEDNFSSSFSADSFSQGDDDVFQFELSQATRVFVEFRVPWSYVGYILRDLGSDPLSVDCDIVSFLSPGITAPCQTTRVSSCLSAGVHGVYMQVFATANVSCSANYTIKITCLDCIPGACCLTDGTCVDGFNDPECEFGLLGFFQGEWSSCCASVCGQECNATPTNVPTLLDGTQGATCSPVAVSDDDCLCYTTNSGPPGPITTTGDLTNSGCEAPDGQQNAYWSLAPGSSDRLWCGHTGTYVLDDSVTKDFIGDTDYYELDLSGESDDTQLRVTITSQLPMTVWIVPERSRNDCPTQGADQTDDIRDLPETLSFGANAGVQTSATFCLSADQHMLMIENAGIIVPCGFSYTVQLDFEPDCQGACCTPTGCQLVAADSAQGSTADQQACDTLKGVYRGLGTRCTDTTANNPLGLNREIDCCTIASVGGDVIDADSATCGAVVNLPNTNDLNGGCVQGPDIVNNPLYQNLGSITVGSGSTGSATVAVYGTTGALKKIAPPVTNRDRDIYKFTVSGGEAELEFFLENNFVELVRILDKDDFLGVGGTGCDFNTTGVDSFTINSTTCNRDASGTRVGQTFVSSGLLTTGDSACLDAEDHYVFVQCNGLPQCSKDYRFSITLYQCRLGACCLDNSLCVGDNDVGFLQCERILGGTFVAGQSCPTGALEGTLCVGVCCIDDDENPGTPVVCQTNTRYQDCCLGDGALDQDDPNAPGYAQGEFLGYSVGDNALPTDCNLLTNPCVPSGACCTDSGAGYVCTEDQLEAECTGGGGSYGGDGSTCATAPCNPGACCVGANCIEPSSPQHCAGLTGTYQGDGVDCGSVVCSGTPTGACCFACPDGATCVDSQTVGDCKTTLKGIYAGDGTVCSAICSNFCRADLNGDGSTDVFDFPIFSGHFAQSVSTRCFGDLNCDGVVDVFDFPIFSGNFSCNGSPHPTCP